MVEIFGRSKRTGEASKKIRRETKTSFGFKNDDDEEDGNDDEEVNDDDVVCDNNDDNPDEVAIDLCAVEVSLLVTDSSRTVSSLAAAVIRERGVFAAFATKAAAAALSPFPVFNESAADVVMDPPAIASTDKAAA